MASWEGRADRARGGTLLDGAAAPSSSRQRLILLAILLAGGIARIVAFGANTPLWIDESMLALNIGTRGFVGLLHPLAYGQVAPLLFLWLLKGSTLVVGVSEPGLRLVPLVAGLLLPGLTWSAGRRLFGVVTAALGAACVALSPVLVEYSAEAKSYGVGAAVFAAVLLSVTWALEAPGSRRRVVVGVVGLVAIGTTFMAPFILLGAGAALVLDAWARRDRRGLLEGTAWSLGWLVVFGLQYLLTQRAVGQSTMMHRFWDGVMIRFPDEGWRWRFLRSSREAWRFLFAIPAAGGVLATLSLGAAMLPALRRSLATRTLLVLPPLALLLGSIVGAVPIEGRIILPFTPLLALMVASCVEAIWHRATPPLPRAAIVVASGLLLVAVERDPPLHPDDRGRDLVQVLAQARHREPVYVLARGIPDWLFYSTTWDHPDTARLRWYEPLASPGGAAYHNAPSRGRRVGAAAKPLYFRSSSGLELAGRASGQEYQQPDGLVTQAPDPGWDDEEAERLALAADGGDVWVIGSHTEESEITALRGALARLGANLAEEWRSGNAILWRVTFGHGMVTP